MSKTSNRAGTMLLAVRQKTTPWRYQTSKGKNTMTLVDRRLIVIGLIITGVIKRGLESPGVVVSVPEVEVQNTR